ncbi:hypothetical protein [Methylobacterium oryzae]|uniref:hypothetical protein n=1 Tax=Methylobacterium oryzae TaxID=334852 RepID=UPI001F2AE44B|nr:hypothetical protein [Methylobacterium oryzae]UIN38357.1 hypothetical protein LXM90_30715 [Methylobacterium oryzae]
MSTVRPGQIWISNTRLPGGEARYVRVDRIEVQTSTQTVLGLSRTVETQIARVSTRPASRAEFRPTNRFIRLARFSRCYRLIQDTP